MNTRNIIVLAAVGLGVFVVYKLIASQQAASAAVAATTTQQQAPLANLGSTLSGLSSLWNSFQGGNGSTLS